MRKYFLLFLLIQPPQHIEKSQTTFHMSLHNVSNELVRQLHDTALVHSAHGVQLVLTLATDFVPRYSEYYY